MDEITIWPPYWIRWPWASLILWSEFDSQWVSHNAGFVPKLRNVYKIIFFMVIWYEAIRRAMACWFLLQTDFFLLLVSLWEIFCIIIFSLFLFFSFRLSFFIGFHKCQPNRKFKKKKRLQIIFFLFFLGYSKLESDYSFKANKKSTEVIVTRIIQRRSDIFVRIRISQFFFIVFQKIGHSNKIDDNTNFNVCISNNLYKVTLCLSS